MKFPGEIFHCFPGEEDMPNRRYTHVCYHCEREKSEYVWYPFGDRWVCHQCVSPLLLKQESIIQKLAARLAARLAEREDVHPS